MHERTQDGMTYVRVYGHPDLFITITCNSKWKEISDQLMPGQQPKDRHDLIARVFKLKVKLLMDLINKSEIFGSVKCYMYTIEWQKRGLPHAHVLIWLKEKLRANKVDDIISAELPNPVTDPRLFEIVRTQMIHGPCGNVNQNSPCMKNKQCTKRYPRPFLKETQSGQDGYPLYRRRSPQDGGFTTTLKIRGSDVIVDNSWVVPYCPLLSRIFDAHINVEYCNSVKSIKYVCKYINKGSDMAVFEITDKYDEIKQFQLGRYVSTNEAIWRILEFHVHERYPTVMHLHVHLENGQRVYFTPETALQRAEAPQGTTLTAFFDLCNVDDFACTLLYNEVPRYYTWNIKDKKWIRRKNGKDVENHPGVKSSDALGRVYTVHINHFDCFYLRLLLHNVRGPKSFITLRTFNGIVCETYKRACELHGLLENDAHWDNALEEAASIKSPTMLRNLFSMMLQICAISNPLELWNKHRESMSEDILFQERNRNSNFNMTFNDLIFNKALILIEDKIINLGGADLKTFGLPTPHREDNSHLPNEVINERNYNLSELSQFIELNESKLLPEQKEALDIIVESVINKTGGLFFLDAPGGTGKTFLLNILLAKIREKGLIALPTASSGIAATLLSGGRTAHSLFKLPLNLASMETPTCNIGRGSGRAKLLEECSLFVLDECSMIHKLAVEAINRTLQDLRRDQRLMGGVTFVFAGDFRQILPVIPRGSKADVLNACLKASFIWNSIQRLNLTTNMRAHLTNNPSAANFAKILLTLGNGHFTADNDNGIISTKDLGRNVKTIQELKEAVFPNLRNNFLNFNWICERAILAPTNDSVNRINLELLAKLPGDTHLYKSIDTVQDNEDAINYPTEFLNSLELSGIPSHNLHLKIGAPIMMLRNLDPPNLCNGTRLIVKKLMPNLIEAEIITGRAAGQSTLIPRIPIIPSNITFEFKRLQFPIRLSFAMSINKAQGQTLQIVGLNLLNPCFSHGQLYVGCSRVGNPNHLYILAPDEKTTNVVYPEII
jgi:ATP-dependent DNA helicase PIF1